MATAPRPRTRRVRKSDAEMSAMKRVAQALHLDSPELWGARVSIAGGPWFQLVRPRVQHLVHSSVLPAPDGSDDVGSIQQLVQEVPRLYHSRAVREDWGADAQYWMHLAHDRATMVEMAFTVPEDTLHEDNEEPLRWRVGDRQPCVVQLVLRLPMGELLLRNENVLLEFEYSMDFTAYPCTDKEHHYLMAVLASDHTAEMEFQSRLDVKERSGYYYHPTSFAVQIRTDALVFAMAVHNRWFKDYLQALGVLPLDSH